MEGKRKLLVNPELQKVKRTTPSCFIAFVEGGEIKVEILAKRTGQFTIQQKNHFIP